MYEVIAPLTPDADRCHGGVNDAHVLVVKAAEVATLLGRGEGGEGEGASTG